MKNATYGYYSATTGTLPGFINQGTASAPAANKFINVTNPIFQAVAPTGAWTYNWASDDNTGGVANGTGFASVTMFNTGITVLSQCGTATPGLRKGISDGVEKGFVVYPNPFAEEFILDFEEEEIADYQLSILNTLGVIVFNQTGKATEGKNQLKLSISLPPGIYLLSLQTGGKTYRVKVIKN